MQLVPQQLVPQQLNSSIRTCSELPELPIMWNRGLNWWNRFRILKVRVATQALVPCEDYLASLAPACIAAKSKRLLPQAFHPDLLLARTASSVLERRLHVEAEGALQSPRVQWAVHIADGLNLDRIASELNLDADTIVQCCGRDEQVFHPGRRIG